MHGSTMAHVRAALYTLSFGNFVIGTGTMIIAGLLTLMAEDLETSPAAVGQLIAGYGIAVCFGAPILAGITSHISRRRLLVAALTLYAVGHWLAALAPNYTVLMVLRILTGFGAAIFTPQAATTGGMLVPVSQRGRAVALVFLGFSISSVLGNPAGVFLGAAFGWRVSLAVIGALSAICAIALYRQVPQKFFVERIDAAAWGQVWRNGPLLLVLATTALQGTAQFVLLAYLAAVLKVYLGLDPAGVGLLFAWFGVCGIAGNIIAGALVDRMGPPRVVMMTMGFMLAGLLLWPLTQGSLVYTLLTLGLWGFGCFATNGVQQARLIGMAPHLASASVALNSSSFYLGQAGGAMIGGIALTSLGMDALSWVGAGVLLLGFASSLLAQTTRRVSPA